MIFDEIRGHLVILSFYRAQTRNSEVSLRKKAIKFEVDVLDTPNFHSTSNIMILKVKKNSFSRIYLGGVNLHTPLIGLISRCENLKMIFKIPFMVYCYHAQYNSTFS